MDKYIRKIITMLEHHFKPVQCGTIRKQGYNGCHNVEDMIAMIHNYSI